MMNKGELEEIFDELIGNYRVSELEHISDSFDPEDHEDELNDYIFNLEERFRKALS